jgi:CubicO group peptidase (beta-lactamase class C family)
MAEPFFDLASLAKPLVTAPLALRHLDLDADRRGELGFGDRAEPLTVRQLLSHSSGLPPWLPYTGEPLAEQLRRGFPVGAHPLLRLATPGTSTYSDLNYRLLAELLEAHTGETFTALAEVPGLEPMPFPAEPAALPEGPDAAAWVLAEPGCPLPPRRGNLPHDANARAGMRGHAGFGATPTGLRRALEAWVAGGWPARMALETARAEDGARWGLGLQRVPGGAGRFGQLLATLGDRRGIQVLVDTGDPDPLPAPALTGEATWDSPFWYHYGYTGPALFVRPDTGLCIGLLLHRRGPGGGLLDVEGLRARRWNLLEKWIMLGSCAPPGGSSRP